MGFPQIPRVRILALDEISNGYLSLGLIHGSASPLPPFPSTSDCDITPALGAPEAPAKESPLSSPDFQVQILACNGTHKGQSRAPPASVRRPRPSESTDESSFWRRSAAKSTYAESSEEEVQDSGDEFVFEEKRQQQPARGKGVKGRTHGKGRASVAPKRSTGGKKLTSSSAGNNGAKVLKSSASMPDLKSRRNELARTDSQTSLFSTISATPSKMSGKARSLDVDPAEGDWVEPTEPLVWIFVWTQTQQLETTQHNAKAGFWWPAEVMLSLAVNVRTDCVCSSNGIQSATCRKSLSWPNST